MSYASLGLIGPDRRARKSRRLGVPGLLLHDGRRKKSGVSMSKTFGLKTPTDLYRKLLYDIERLRNAVSSDAVTYAAFDCAVAATHIADWVLMTVDEGVHIKLTGAAVSNKGDVSLSGFEQTSGHRVPALRFCRDIANHVKHVRLTRSKPMPNTETGRSVRFDPPFDAERGPALVQRVYAFAYIKVDDQKYPVIELFQDMAGQWERFLKEEGLFQEDSVAQG
ncbi:hypothetical protein [Sinorhizobium meliloti]|uniref:hypothetical protein n=1 Tax=Rhizobium meliloti TaxID=382 RepID=UPI0030AC4385